MRYDVAAGSVVGRIRRNNEDNLIVDEEILALNHKDSDIISKEFTSDDARLVGVFDGMGGHCDGEKASYIAAETARQFCGRKNSRLHPEKKMHALCMEMNDNVCNEADGSKMGTTCALLYLYDGKYTVCNVGDSPVFLIRDKIMTQISVDHNQRAIFERATGKPAPVNQKFKLTQCIGIPKDEMIIEPYIASGEVQSGDFFLLCSDGVTDMIPFEEIHAIISQFHTPEAAVSKLIDAAIEAGGRDNITAVCVCVREAPPRVKILDGFLKRFFG